MTVTMDPREYLQPKLVEGILNREMELNLDFKDIFPERLTDATRFQYSEDLTTAGDDITSGVMGEPNELTEEAGLNTIDLSSITFKHGVLNGFGYQVKVNPRTLREVDIIDELERAYVRAGYGMAQNMNNNVLAKLKAVSNGITEPAGVAVWSADNADPIYDIVNIKNTSRVEGYKFRMNNLYLHPTNFGELEQYMIGVDRNWAIDPRNGGDEVPSIRGVRINEVTSSELDEGAYLGLDSRFPAMTIYKYMDPAKSSNPQDNRIMVRRYVEEAHPQRIVIEMTMEYGLALPLPKAVMYRSSGI